MIIIIFYFDEISFPGFSNGWKKRMKFEKKKKIQNRPYLYVIKIRIIRKK